MVIWKVKNKEDLVKAFNWKQEQILTDVNDILAWKEVVYFYGNLDLSNLTYAKDIKLSKSIGKSLYLDNLESIHGLIIPKDFNYKYLISTYFTIEDLKKISESDKINRKNKWTFLK